MFPRQFVGELMDDPDVDPVELRRSLAYIRAVNRWLGGTRGLMVHLKRWSRSWPRDRSVTLVDVGTGSADIPLAAVAWARRAGFDLRVTAIDNHAQTLAVARERTAGEPAIEVVECDARDLEGRFGAASFDFCHAGLFLHHLADADAQSVLGQMWRVSKRGVVWNDLVRSRWGLVAVNAILVGQPRIVVHDARASVRAGFTRGEAMAMARGVGIENPRYRTILLHRFTLTGTRPGG